MSKPRTLSQAEARERADLLDVVRYDLELDFTDLLEGDALRATSAIRFRSREAGAETFVDCLADVAEATLNGRTLDADDVVGDRLRLRDLAEENELVVRSVQTRTSQAQGVLRSVDPADKLVYVWTTFEPDDARQIFACFDQPDLKAVFGVTALVPEHWLTTSNSGRPEVEELEEGRRFTFADTPRLSTYNIVVNAGPMVELRRKRDGYDLGLFTRQSLASLLERDADELFDLTARGLAFYGEAFGLRFPQDSYDQVFLPDLGGAMENYGSVTWDDQFLHRTAPSHSDRELRALVLLHEMAHMWFGDMVTMRWWDDLWLNESFAEWACHWAATSCTEFTDAWARQLVGDKQDAYAADLAPTTHPIRQPIPDVEAVAASFDDITYPKGAAVLKQLVELVGRDVFTAALRRYFTKHAWSNTTLEDLIAEVETESGRDLTGWVEGWLGTAGTDRLVVTREGDSAHVRVDPPEGRGPLLHRLDIGVYVEEGGRLERRETRQLEVDGDTSLADVHPDAVLLVNDCDLTFASVLPDERSLDAMLTGGGRLPDTLSRCLAVTTAWDLVVRGTIGAERFLSCAVDVLSRETAPSVVEPLLRTATRAANWWSPPSRRDALLGRVAELAIGLAAQPDHRLAAVRALAATATTPEQLDALGRLVGDDCDLRWRRLTRLAELGRYDADEVERLEREDPDPDAWQNALAARAARPETDAKQEAWDRAFGDPGLGTGALGVLGPAFWRPGQDEVLHPFAEDYRTRLVAIGERGMLRALVTTTSLLPRAGVDTDDLDALEAAAKEPDVVELVSKRVLEGTDGVRRMLHARGLTEN